MRARGAAAEALWVYREPIREAASSSSADV
jgi:hypothetical protein